MIGSSGSASHASVGRSRRSMIRYWTKRPATTAMPRIRLEVDRQAHRPGEPPTLLAGRQPGTGRTRQKNALRIAGEEKDGVREEHHRKHGAGARHPIGGPIAGRQAPQRGAGSGPRHQRDDEPGDHPARDDHVQHSQDQRQPGEIDLGALRILRREVAVAGHLVEQADVPPVPDLDEVRAPRYRWWPPECGRHPAKASRPRPGSRARSAGSRAIRPRIPAADPGAGAAGGEGFRRRRELRHAKTRRSA